MKLSKRGEYGLKALIDLAAGDKEDVIRIRELADREQIPIKFLEQILLALKHAGLLQSRRGANGGYYLARPPEEITLGQVIRTLDGPVAPIRCVSQMAYERCVCPDESTCGLRLAMLEVRNAIADVLDGTTLADAARRTPGHPSTRAGERSTNGKHARVTLPRRTKQRTRALPR